jgi:hypothetical protein
MALELEIDKLETAPEALRQYYKPYNGKLRLDVSGVEDVSGLKSALERTKTELREYKSAFKDTGLTAADIGKLVDSNKALIETRAELNAAKIENKITVALITGRATEEGIGLLSEHLVKRVSIENGAFRIADREGRPMPGSGSDGLADFDDLLKETIATYPSLFEGRNAGGGGATGRFSRGAGSKVLTRTQFDQIPHKDRAAKIKEGFTVVDG